MFWKSHKMLVGNGQDQILYFATLFSYLLLPNTVLWLPKKVKNSRFLRSERYNCSLIYLSQHY